MRGLGPRFQLSLDCVQTGAQPLFHVSVALVYCAAFYHVERPLLVLPMLLPGAKYCPQFSVVCVDPLGAADEIRVVVCVGPGGGTPTNTVSVAMPLSATI